MKAKTPKIKIRIPKKIHLEILKDLRRPHPYAFERVGFLYSRCKQLDPDTFIITVIGYDFVKDENYINDQTVGARINSAAIRESMQRILSDKVGCFHVHLHDHSGLPSPSLTDKKETPPIIESFIKIGPKQAHGILIFSADSAYATVKIKDVLQFVIPEIISIVGYPMKLIYPGKKLTARKRIYDRQSFLGPDSQFKFENVQVGIIGFGGGGSHIGQQLSYIGVKKVIVFDDDKAEDTNMNRLIGGWFSDIKKATLKINIAKRLMKRIFPSAEIELINDKWQNRPERLQQCDIIFGCLDSFLSRRELENECRRYLIPYIDIGMDVYKANDEPPYMSGQVILSMPGKSCMTCIGFLTKKNLAQEAAKYGDVGGKPQVVWANGTLASTAIGIFVDLVTSWTGQDDKRVYLAYDGNKGTLNDHLRLKYTNDECPHHSLKDTGSPAFRKL